MEYHSHLYNGMVEEFYLSFKPPIIHGQILDPSEKVIQDDSLSYALLRLMEELSAMERAVYVLKTAQVVHVNN
ncbi:hypothetical protein [Brevibacillus laterosporus]|uniref:hypothetical protein n=1 Tax=Brevibacillus laterosporus TaxID=1465 RepID=UPI003D25130B